MRLPLYQVDAFAHSTFAGNPAAVVPLESWLDDGLMQRIAMENSLPETAFFKQADDGYELRWFTPTCEMDLCGHATLATAHVLFNILGIVEDELCFSTQSGELRVVRKGDWLRMDFPSRPPKPCEVPDVLMTALGQAPREVLAARDYLCVFEHASEIQTLNPQFNRLVGLPRPSIIVTAPGTGNGPDFVSRFFTPDEIVPEDPVTGSAHCTLVPYWAQRLGKDDLLARQVSERGGDIRCQLRGDRVLLSGQAITYLEGHIVIEEEK